MISVCWERLSEASVKKENVAVAVNQSRFESKMREVSVDECFLWAHSEECVCVCVRGDTSWANSWIMAQPLPLVVLGS